MFLRRALLFISVATVILCAPAVSVSHDNHLTPVGFVNDFAGIIDSGTSTKLTQLLTVFEQSTGIEIAVVTISSLDNIPIEDYATHLFEDWGIGKKAKDNGLLIIVAPNEKKMRIEAGYGLEGAINDAVAGRIIRDTMIPWFKNGDFSTGILNGTIGSIDVLNDKYNLGFDPSKAIDVSSAGLKKVKDEKTSLLARIIKIIVVIFMILLFIKNPWLGIFFLMGTGGGRGGGFRGGGFGSGGGGGGFGGFGGGMSGGGGASGSW